MIEIKRYTEGLKEQWNDFLKISKNSSFLFDRNFMDYHSDKFNDYSLLIFYESKLKALIPANINFDTLISHQGLSYGGIVLADELRLSEIIDIFKATLIYLDNNNIVKWRIKLLPRMYHARPSDELDWILFKLNAKLYRRDTALVIDNNATSLQYQERRKRSIKKANNNNLVIKEDFNELEFFWQKILIPNLLDKHGVQPVHSLSEIQLLSQRFPNNIKQHNIYLNNNIVAGCTIFLNKKVVHAQYISGSPEGRNSGSLDFLFDKLIREIYLSYDYFDFGICNEKDGLLINKGLLDWKEGFGARTISHDFYEIDTKVFFLLNYYLF